MKKLVAPLILGGVAFFGLYACMTTEDGSSVISLEWDLPVTNLNQTTHVITTREIDYDCYDAVVKSDTSLETQNYHITSGKMYMWESGECGAEVYSGSSTTIIGAWTLDAFTEMAIPVAVRPSGCGATVDEEDTSSAGALEQMFQDAKGTATISTSNVHLTLSGKLCFAPIFAEVFSGSSAVEVTSSDCSTVNLKSGSTTATLTTSYSNNNLNISFKSGGKTCTLTGPLTPPNQVPTCPASNSPSSSSAFSACLETTAFGGDDMAKMSSSAVSPITRAIRKSTRYPRF